MTDVERALHLLAHVEEHLRVYRAEVNNAQRGYSQILKAVTDEMRAGTLNRSIGTLCADVVATGGDDYPATLAEIDGQLWEAETCLAEAKRLLGVNG